MMLRFEKFLFILILIAAWVFSGWPQIWQNPPIPPGVEETSAGAPAAPVFTTVPYESSGDPINYGSNQVFSGTANDANSNNWYLAICKTDAVTGGMPPTCGGGAYCVSSSAVASGLANTCTWPADTAGPKTWYGFACDDSTQLKCSLNSNANSPLAVNALAPTVGTDAASSVTANSATLNGNISATGGANATVRGFAWGKNLTLSGGDTATTTDNGDWGVDTFTYGASPLTSNTTYYFRAYATNSGGTGYGSILNFTTSAATSLTAIVSTDAFPTVIPGVAVFATTTIDVNTNSSSGWNVTLYGNDQGPSDTVMDLDTDASVGIIDQLEWIAGAATTTAGNAVRISSLDNSNNVLAFRMMTASGTPSFWAPSWWGGADNYSDNANTLWAGIASSTDVTQIGNSSVDSGGGSALNTLLYYLKVPSSQKSGVYSGNLTFTTIVNP